jgi:SagB-type dehydrogenase family enzyme
MFESRREEEKLRIVRGYHERTKHRPDRYAASPGFMDWANQPNPFRTFSGAEQIDLPHPPLRKTPTYDSLFSRKSVAAELDADLVGRLFYHSLALSAWKQAPGTNPWTLRINPSSGALHPTEGYLISGPVSGLIDQPGVFHYAPFRHRLERRCRLSLQQWNALSRVASAPILLMGLTSIYWRESWKYGERAFRYCHLDVGHAIGAIAFSARVVDWNTRVLDTIVEKELNSLLCTDLQKGIEAEHADCLLLLNPTGAHPSEPSLNRLSPEDWRNRLPDVDCTGRPNQLSRKHHEWPAIEEASLAAQRDQGDPIALRKLSQTQRTVPRETVQDRGLPAERVIRQRRSAVGMNGNISLDRAGFYHMLQRTLPAHFPFRTLPWDSHVSLALFVHRINGLEPGLYLLARDESHESSLRKSLGSGFDWKQPAGCPRELHFYRLVEDDMRSAAQLISCHQDIACDGVFSLGMLAEFNAALSNGGAAAYPRLFWECGLIGQVLYLEAEAAGIRGTGIGCFFDDVVHDLLGIADHSWQSLYHFTVGAPFEDRRIKTIPPYIHLDQNQGS